MHYPLQQTIGAWRVIFFVTIGLYVIEILAYMIFGSGEEQSWNRQAIEPEKTELNSTEKPEHTENTPLNTQIQK